jgi:hypothetical protein
MTDVTSFIERLAEIASGSRGSISIGEFSDKSGISPKVLRQVAEERGFEIRNHGRYGYCVFRKRG